MKIIEKSLEGMFEMEKLKRSDDLEDNLVYEFTMKSRELHDFIQVYFPDTVQILFTNEKITINGQDFRHRV